MITALIDTNVLMVALSPRSNLHWLYTSFINEEFLLVVSTEINLEYEEQLRFRYGDSVVAEFLLILAEATNVLSVEPHFKWNLIAQDPEDNKFVDAYVISAADYLVTHDKHFDVLKQINFPVINVIDAYSFRAVLENNPR
jgi:putative PIN family toxin of toxin-antitoxin system